MSKQTESCNRAYDLGYHDGYDYGKWNENPFPIMTPEAESYEDGRADGIRHWNDKEKA